MEKNKRRPKLEKYARNTVTGFAISKEEKALLNDAAKERGCSISSLVRRCLFSDFHIYTEHVPKLQKGIKRRYSYVDSDEMEKYEEVDEGKPLIEVLNSPDDDIGLELGSILDLINEEEENG